MRNRILDFFYSVAGDLGLFNHESVQPIRNGQDANEENLGRDSANLRNRTDILRDDSECLRRLVMGNMGLRLFPLDADATIKLNSSANTLEASETFLSLASPRTGGAFGMNILGRVDIDTAIPDQPFRVTSCKHEFQGGNRIELSFVEDPTLDPTNTVNLTVEGGASIKADGEDEYTIGNKIQVEFGSTATAQDFSDAVDASAVVDSLIDVTDPFFNFSNQLTEHERILLDTSTDTRVVVFPASAINTFFETDTVGAGEVFGISFESQGEMERHAASGIVIGSPDFYITKHPYVHNQVTKFNIPLFYRTESGLLVNALNGVATPVDVEGLYLPEGGFEQIDVENTEEITTDYGASTLSIPDGNLGSILRYISRLIKGRLGLEGGTISGQLTVNSTDIANPGVIGVAGAGSHEGTGVLGLTPGAPTDPQYTTVNTGVGVYGASDQGVGVYGYATSPGFAGVVGVGAGGSSHFEGDYNLVGGIFIGGAGNSPGVFARGMGTSPGVHAIGYGIGVLGSAEDTGIKGVSIDNGIGVVGEGHGTGAGGTFTGGNTDGIGVTGEGKGEGAGVKGLGVKGLYGEAVNTGSESVSLYLKPQPDFPGDSADLNGSLVYIVGPDPGIDDALAVCLNGTWVKITTESLA